jgi:hypothetical protein
MNMITISGANSEDYFHTCTKTVYGTDGEFLVEQALDTKKYLKAN